MKVLTSSGVANLTLANIIANERKAIGNHVVECFKAKESIDKIQDYILKADNDLKLFIQTITDNQDLTLIQDSKTGRYSVAQ